MINNVSNLHYIAAGNRGTFDYVRGGTVLSTGTIYHLAWQSTGTAWKLFVNGIEQSLTATSGSNTGDWFDITGSGTPGYRIGDNFRFGAEETFFSGVIDDVKIYNAVLTASEILSIANGDQSITRGLVASYPLRRLTISDISGSGNTGTNVGAALIDAIAKGAAYFEGPF